MLKALKARPFTLALISLSAALSTLGLSSEAALSALRCQWQAVAAGELWRLLTGPLVHANLHHALVDLLPLAGLGVLLEARLPRAVPMATITALLLAPPVAWIAYPQLAGYVGSSPAAYALFSLAIVARGHRPRPRWLQPPLGLLLVGLMGHTLWRATTGAGSMIVPGIASVPLTHLVGAIIGVFVGSIASRDKWTQGVALLKSERKPWARTP